MSEVSLNAAYGAYREHALSNQLEDLYTSIVKGQAKNNYKITQIYTFIDVDEDVQLFYCRNGNTEDLFTSPHVKKLKLVWDEKGTYTAPKYFLDAYINLLKQKGVSEADIVALGLSIEASTVPEVTKADPTTPAQISTSAVTIAPTDMQFNRLFMWFNVIFMVAYFAALLLNWPKTTPGEIVRHGTSQNDQFPLVFLSGIAVWATLDFYLYMFWGFLGNSLFWSSAEGKVYFSQRRVGQNGVADIRYVFQINGKEYHSSRVFSCRQQGSDASDLERYKVGTPVTVYYPPKSPSNAVLSKGIGSNWIWVAVIMVVDIFLLGAIFRLW